MPNYFPSTGLGQILADRVGKDGMHRYAMPAVLASGCKVLSGTWRTGIAPFDLIEDMSSHYLSQTPMLARRSAGANSPNVTAVADLNASSNLAASGATASPVRQRVWGLRFDVVIPADLSLSNLTIQIPYETGGVYSTKSKLVNGDTYSATNAPVFQLGEFRRPSGSATEATATIFVFGTSTFEGTTFYSPFAWEYDTDTAANEVLPTTKVTPSNTSSEIQIATTLLTRGQEDVEGLLGWRSRFFDLAGYGGALGELAYGALSRRKLLDRIWSKPEAAEALMRNALSLAESDLASGSRTVVG